MFHAARFFSSVTDASLLPGWIFVLVFSACVLCAHFVRGLFLSSLVEDNALMRRRLIFRRPFDHDAAPLSGGHEQRGRSDDVPHLRNEKNRAADAQGTRAVG